MKVAFSIILSTILFAASFQNSLFLLDYQINRNFYEIHCANKAKPEMDCHGKCQMQKESEKTSNPFKLVKYSFEFNILPSASPEFSLKTKDLPVGDLTNFKFEINDFSEIVLSILPHPPQIFI